MIIWVSVERQVSERRCSVLVCLLACLFAKWMRMRMRMGCVEEECSTGWEGDGRTGCCVYMCGGAESWCVFAERERERERGSALMQDEGMLMRDRIGSETKEKGCV